MSLSADEQRLLAELPTHPAWNVLRKEVKERMDRDFLRLAHEIMSGDVVETPVIEYRRGFFAGMKFLLDKPAAEEAALLKALARGEDVKGHA